jgi:hypothetical protein|eukprot:COSAG06_NODE_358_length_16848_cov_13.836587_4_plen_83_part_00
MCTLTACAQVGEQSYEQMKLGAMRDRQDEPVVARQSTQKRRKWRSGKQAHIPQTLQSTLSIASRFVNSMFPWSSLDAALTGD